MNQDYDPANMDYARENYVKHRRELTLVVTEHEMTPERSAHLGKNLIGHLNNALGKVSEKGEGIKKFILDLRNIQTAGVYCIAAIMDFMCYVAKETQCRDLVVKGIRGELREVMEGYGVYEAITHSNEYVRKKRKRYRRAVERNKALSGSRKVAKYLFGKKSYKELGLESCFGPDSKKKD